MFVFLLLIHGPVHRHLIWINLAPNVGIGHGANDRQARDKYIIGITFAAFCGVGVMSDRPQFNCYGRYEDIKF